MIIFKTSQLFISHFTSCLRDQSQLCTHSGMRECVPKSIALKKIIMRFWWKVSKLGKLQNMKKKTSILAEITDSYTLTGPFIRYTLLVPGWTPFCILNCLNSLWHRFNKVLERFLRDFGSYLHESITQLLQICQLHIIFRISCPTTSQRCSIGLRTGDCGGN